MYAALEGAQPQTDRWGKFGLPQSRRGILANQNLTGQVARKGNDYEKVNWGFSNGSTDKRNSDEHIYVILIISITKM